MEIGVQIGEMYSEEMIHDCPFEAIYRINSTFGRLKVLYHSDELSSLPDFAKLESMKEIIGVIHRSNSLDKGNIILKLIFYRFNYKPKFTFCWMVKGKEANASFKNPKANKVYLFRVI